MLVYVHAYERSPGSAGSGGFDWFRTQAEADASYERAGSANDQADFRFDVEVEATEDADVTDEIDAQLDDLCAAASVRRVGEDVLRYWRDNGFDMGDAENPASAGPRP